MLLSIRAWLKKAQEELKTAGVTTTRLDCLVLLGDALGKDKAWILSHADEELQGSVLENLNTKIAQRAKHVPLAYIRGHAEFYGREFTVNEHTLVPRPETETMIDMLRRVRNMEADVLTWQRDRKKRPGKKKRYAFEKAAPESSLVKTEEGYKVVWHSQRRHPESKQPRSPELGSGSDSGSRASKEQMPNQVRHDGQQDSSLRWNDSELLLVDIGTGSGAIAITAKLEIPDATVIAADIDEKCLETAHINAQKLGADIEFKKGNLLEAVSDISMPDNSVIILLCNLPYVPDNFQINTAATHEPRHALFGGQDGLDLYHELFTQISAQEHKPSYVLTESLPPQHEKLAEIAKEHGYTLLRTDDFIQAFTIQA